jgi:hypothetical protein
MTEKEKLEKRTLEIAAAAYWEGWYDAKNSKDFDGVDEGWKHSGVRSALLLKEAGESK